MTLDESLNLILSLSFLPREMIGLVTSFCCCCFFPFSHEAVYSSNKVLIKHNQNISRNQNEWTFLLWLKKEEGDGEKESPDMPLVLHLPLLPPTQCLPQGFFIEPQDYMGNHFQITHLLRSNSLQIVKCCRRKYKQPEDPFFK